jgi:hypothetical protein
VVTGVAALTVVVGTTGATDGTDVATAGALVATVVDWVAGTVVPTVVGTPGTVVTTVVGTPGTVVGTIVGTVVVGNVTAAPIGAFARTIAAANPTAPAHASTNTVLHLMTSLSPLTVPWT